MVVQSYCNGNEHKRKVQRHSNGKLSICKSWVVSNASDLPVRSSRLISRHVVSLQIMTPNNPLRPKYEVNHGIAGDRWRPPTHRREHGGLQSWTRKNSSCLLRHWGKV
jgi:hypothetical protein